MLNHRVSTVDDLDRDLSYVFNHRISTVDDLDRHLSDE